MATRYRFGDSQYPHFINYAVVNRIDAISRQIYKDIIVNSPEALSTGKRVDY